MSDSEPELVSHKKTTTRKTTTGSVQTALIGDVYDSLCIRLSLALVEAVLKKLALGK